jgi:hypothetical protein
MRCMGVKDGAVANDTTDVFRLYGWLRRYISGCQVATLRCPRDVILYHPNNTSIRTEGTGRRLRVGRRKDGRADGLTD